MCLFVVNVVVCVCMGGSLYMWMLYACVWWMFSYVCMREKEGGGRERCCVFEVCVCVCLWLMSFCVHIHVSLDRDPTAFIRS